MKSLLIKLALSLLGFLLRSDILKEALTELALKSDNKLDDVAVQVFLQASGPIADALDPQS